jgi:hypothetical protein
MGLKSKNIEVNPINNRQRPSMKMQHVNLASNSEYENKNIATLRRSDTLLFDILRRMRSL